MAKQEPPNKKRKTNEGFEDDDQDDWDNDDFNEQLSQMENICLNPPAVGYRAQTTSQAARHSYIDVSRNRAGSVQQQKLSSSSSKSASSSSLNDTGRSGNTKEANTSHLGTSTSAFRSQDRNRSIQNISKLVSNDSKSDDSYPSAPADSSSSFSSGRRSNSSLKSSKCHFIHDFIKYIFVLQCNMIQYNQ